MNDPIDMAIDLGLRIPELQPQIAKEIREHLDRVRLIESENKARLQRDNDEINSLNRRAARLRFEIAVLKGEAFD